MSASPTGGGVPAPADQPARTALAWSRTTLGFLAVGVLLGRTVWVDGVAPLAVPVVGVVGLLAAVAARRRAHLRRFASGPGTVLAGDRAAVALVAVGVVVMAALAAVLAVGS